MMDTETSEMLTKLGWSKELIEETAAISKVVSKSAVTEKYNSEAELMESNVSQSSSLLFENTNVSGSLLVR